MADRLLLVVEGPDDKHVFLAILDRHQFEPHFAIRDEGGFETLLARVSVHLKPGSDLERFGIVVDADAEILTRWLEIKRTLERAGYNSMPDSPDPTGTIVDHQDLPKVGVWIMPDNTLPGMLEDYLCYLVPEGDVLLERAIRCVSEIPAEERCFVEAHTTKALIYTWLAWQKKPGKPFGQAILKHRYFDTNGPHVQGLLDWLTRLFA